MKTRSRWVVVALAVLALSIPATALDKERPVTGSLVGSDEFGDSCGGGQGITLTSTGLGEIAHFGKAVMVSPVCVTEEYEVLGEWPFTIIAANGDTVSGIVTGFEVTDYGFDLFAEITDGTGRFDGATGELTFPTASDQSGVWTSTVEGWISY